MMGMKRYMGLFLWWCMVPLVLLANVTQSVENTLNTLKSLSAEPLYNYNFEAAQTLLDDALRQNPAIGKIVIYDTLTQKPFLTVEKPNVTLDELEKVEAEVRYKGEKIGRIELFYSTTLLSLTPQEKEWIKQHSTVSVGIVEQEPIMLFKEGNVSGMVGEYLSLIATRTGLRFKATSFKQRSDLEEAFQQGHISLIPSVEKDDIVREWGSVSKSYMQFPYVLVSRIKEPFIDSLDELEDKKIALPVEAPSYRLLQVHYPSLALLPTHDVIEALEAVKANRAFAFLGHMAVAMHYVGNYYSNSLHIAGKTDLFFQHAMLVHQDDAILLSILNKAIDAITQQEHLEIKNRWLHIEVKEAVDYTFIYTVGGVFLLLILASLYWNKKLTAEIHERKRVEVALEKAKREAEQANRAKSIFLATMSHEIRTPMNAIAGFTELLSEEVKTPRLQSYVQSIQNASHTLLRLINDILDLSKIEAGKLEMEYHPTDIAKMCEEILSVFELTAQKKRIDLLLEIDPDLPRTLLIDEIRLRQILLNLVGNAVKFTQEGYVKVIVEVSPSTEDEHYVDIILTIEDSGIGIPAEQQADIFDAFVQTQGQDNRKYEGTGLGLSISKRLTEMMGGSIAVKSQPGKGSKFIVSLFDVEVDRSRNKPSLVAETFDVTAFEKARILIVDDVEDNRELLVRIFEKSSIETVTANNGEEGVERFFATLPDLVLMDLRMPKMDGFKATELIKEASPQTPVIALSATVIQDDRFDASLAKPVSKQELLGLLTQFLPYQKQIGSKKEPTQGTLQKEVVYTVLKGLPAEKKAKMVEAYTKAVQSNSIPDIEAFVSYLEHLQKEEGIHWFKPYIEQMRMALDTFDIAKLESLLEEFYRLLTELELKI